MAVLYVVQADGSLGTSWPVEGESLVVGRGEVAAAQIDDKALSRSHFMIAREGEKYLLVDLESQNGTWLGSRRVSGARLQWGDIIRAGQTLFYFSPEEMKPGVKSVELPAAVLGSVSQPGVVPAEARSA